MQNNPLAIEPQNFFFEIKQIIQSKPIIHNEFNSFACKKEQLEFLFILKSIDSLVSIQWFFKQ